MKKTIIALTALTLVLSLTACGTAGTAAPDTDSAAETTVAVMAEEASETTADAEAETTAAEDAAESEETETEAAEAEADAEAPAADEAALMDQTFALLEKYSEIDGIAACGVHSDSADVFQPENTEIIYQHVTDDRFQSAADLKAFLAQTVTGDAEKAFADEMFNDEHPTYLEKDGKLYVMQGGRGAGFDFDKDSIKLSDITEDGFHAEVSYPLPGGTITKAQVTLKAVDGAYRISAFQPEG